MSEYKRFQSRRNKIAARWKLGVELWQFLIILTVIFTTASFILWFVNVRPRDTETQFISVGKVKAGLYNHYQTIKLLPKKEINVSKNNYPLSAPCYSEIQGISVDYDIADRYIERIGQSEEASSALRIEISNDNFEASRELEITKIFDKFGNYTTENKTYYEKKETYLKEVLQVKKLVSRICLQNVEKAEKELFVLKSELKDLKSKGGIDQSWLQSVDFWVEAYLEVLDKSQGDFVAVERDLVKLRPGFEKIFEYEFEEEKNFEKIRKSEADFLQEIEKIESWEEEFVSNNRHLESKFVRVFED